MWTAGQDRVQDKSFVFVFMFSKLLFEQTFQCLSGLCAHGIHQDHCAC